jgi:hypothetical protein
LPTIEAGAVLDREAPAPSPYFHGTSKPYTRWWWLAGPFRHDDIRAQLGWLVANGFGGVELAWLWPTWMGRSAEPGIDWLSTEWANLVTFAKQEADRLGLGCDFTFGSCPMKTTAGSTGSLKPSGHREPITAGRCGTSSSPARRRATLARCKVRLAS